MKIPIKGKDKIIPIHEWTADDKACEVLVGVDFTRAADLIKAISNVAELIRKYKQQHDSLAEKLVGLLDEWRVRRSDIQLTDECLNDVRSAILTILNDGK